MVSFTSSGGKGLTILCDSLILGGNHLGVSTKIPVGTSSAAPSMQMRSAITEKSNFPNIFSSVPWKLPKNVSLPRFSRSRITLNVISVLLAQQIYQKYAN